MSTSPTTPPAPASPDGRPRPGRSRSVWRAGLVAAVVAAVVNTLVWLLGLLTPATWEVTQGGQTRQVLAVMPAMASVVALAAGTLALWLLRRVPRGVTVWTVLAVVVGVGSVVAPLQGAEDPWTGALLALMHLVALAAALLLLRPAALAR